LAGAVLGRCTPLDFTLTTGAGMPPAYGA